MRNTILGFPSYRNIVISLKRKVKNVQRKKDLYY